jgi:hypothetical protein
MPLMVAMFKNSERDLDERPPVDVFEVRDDDLRHLATQQALHAGKQIAMQRFDVDSARMAAFMAVHTRQGKQAKRR